MTERASAGVVAKLSPEGGLSFHFLSVCICGSILLR